MDTNIGVTSPGEFGMHKTGHHMKDKQHEKTVPEKRVKSEVFPVSLALCQLGQTYFTG